MRPSPPQTARGCQPLSYAHHGHRQPFFEAKKCHRTDPLQCDEAKPSCGLCRRLGIKCVDNGVRRWKFVHEAAEADAAAAPALVSTSTTTALVSVPRAARRPILSVPQNKTTALTAALVRLLEVRDVRYSVRVFGDQSMEALPSQLGASPELDTTISAVVALYGSRLSGASRVEGLRCYGRALAATRRAVAAYEAAPTVAIHSMLMIWMCQVSSRPICTDACSVLEASVLTNPRV